MVLITIFCLIPIVDPHDSRISIVIEGDNVVNMNSFGATKMASIEHNFNSLDYSVSDGKDSVLLTLE